MTALKILVIDDDADARHLLEQVLRTAGYAVTLVVDAEQALALLADQPVDISCLTSTCPACPAWTFCERCVTGSSTARSFC